MPPFDQIGGWIGGQLKNMATSAFDAAMTAIWDAALAVLRAAFGLADQFSVFSVDTHSGPISVVWPLMMWLSGLLALGLFFWQMVLTNLRGGRGFLRLVGGPVQYGIALAVTVGMVGGFLTAADGMTTGILQYGLQTQNFTAALDHTTFGQAVVTGISAVVLGICAVIGVIPAALGYVVEMLFREAAIYVLVACVPIVAAGLLANVTAAWFWRTVRWMLAAIVMKPVLALTLVIGVAIAGGAQGVAGLLAGVAVLVISLAAPFVLFRLFAFVDPHSDTGAAFRDALAGVGVDSYGNNNPALLAAGAVGGSGGGGAIESANTGRFDEAIAGAANHSMDESGIGDPSSGGGSGPDTSSSDTAGPDGGAVDGGGSGGGGGAGAVPPAANRGQVVSSSPSSGPTGDYGGGSSGGGSGGPDGGDPPPPEPPDSGGTPRPPDGGGGGGGPKSGGSGAGEAVAGEAEEAEVII